MKRVIPIRDLTLAGIATASTLWLVSPALAQFTPQGVRPPVRAPSPLKAHPRSGPAMPTLTEAERTQALSIATSSARLQAILSGHTYTVRNVAVWLTKDHAKLGAAVTLALPRPTSFEHDWPYIEYDKADPSFSRYQTRTARWGVENVRELFVLVDLSKNDIVNITPAPTGGPRVVKPASGLLPT